MYLYLFLKNNCKFALIMDPNPTLSNKAKEDVELIHLAMNGESKAYDKLMKKYRKSVYYLILKMIRYTNDAEDITQETFTKAFSSLDKYDSKFAFSTWLYKIASNACIDFIRKKKLDTMSISVGVLMDDESTMEIQIKDSNLIPDAEMFKTERNEYLNKAIEQLPEKYKILIDLRYFKELSYDELAEKMDLPLGTVKAQLHRAKELLNEALSNIEHDI